MNSNYFTESVRKLRTDEKIPYDLLLLADETIEAIDKCIEDSEIYILEKQQKILGVYVLQFIDKRSVEIKYIAVDEKFQGQGIGTFLLDVYKRQNIYLDLNLIVSPGFFHLS